MLSDSLLKPWRVFSFKHNKSFLVHSEKGDGCGFEMDVVTGEVRPV